MLCRYFRELNEAWAEIAALGWRNPKLEGPLTCGPPPLDCMAHMIHQNHFHRGVLGMLDTGCFICASLL